jgi:hypothetical protein
MGTHPDDQDREPREEPDAGPAAGALPVEPADDGEPVPEPSPRAPRPRAPRRRALPLSADAAPRGGPFPSRPFG